MTEPYAGIAPIASARQTMRLTAAHCGFVRMDAGLVEQGTRSNADLLLPVTCFFVELDDQLIVFDTGMSPAVIEDPVGHWGRLAETLVAPMLETDQLLSSRLAQAGYGVDDVTLLVNSHLHHDHSGQNSIFAGARTLVRRREFEYARKVGQRLGAGFCWVDIAQDREPAFIEHDDEHALDEAGALTLLPTPGHSPGHQALRVRFPSGATFVLGGDVAYSTGSDGSLRPPPKLVNFDDGAAHRSAERIDAEAEAGADIVLTHDVQRWADRDGVTVIHEEQRGPTDDG
jgi:N-acyl homoserine lactone hydrolase